MRDPASPGSEEDEITGACRFDSVDPMADPVLLLRVPRYRNSLLGQQQLDEAGAVHAGGRPSAPQIRNTEQPLDSLVQGRRLPRRREGGGGHPSSPAVGEFDPAVPSSKPSGNDPRVPEQRAHQSTPSGRHARLGKQGNDSRPRLPAPPQNPDRRRGHEAPTPHPALVAIGLVADAPPCPVWSPSQDRNRLPQQQLAAQLAAVVRPPPNIEGREGHDTPAQWFAAHSLTG